MNPNESPIAFVIFIALYLVSVHWLAQRAWRKFQRFAPARKFNFHLSDFWAATVGLTPSLLCISWCLESCEPWMLCACLALPAQLAGMFIARLSLLRDFPEDPAGQSAGYILFGAFAGICFVPVYVIGFGTVLPAAVVYAVLYGDSNERHVTR